MSVAIVGAGITGACAAHALKGEPSLQVTVFDQGQRGPGGRASHRRINHQSGAVVPDETVMDPDAVSTLEFDHGCQFLRADTPQMRELVEQWCEAGWAAEWKGRFGKLHGGVIRGSFDASGEPGDFFGLPDNTAPVYVGVGGMHRLPRAVLAGTGATIEPGIRVTSVSRVASGKWRLRGTDGPGAFHDTPESVAAAASDQLLGEFDAVLLTDASTSLGGWHRASGNVESGGEGASPAEAEAAEAALELVRNRVRVPLFTALVGLSWPVGHLLPYDAFTVGGGESPLWWAARSQSKPGFPAGACECWTLVSTSEYAVKQIESTPMIDPETGAFRPQEPGYLTAEPGPRLFESFFAAIKPFLDESGGAPPMATYIDAQRWGSAMPSPASYETRDENGYAPWACREVYGIMYADHLPKLVYDRPVVEKKADQKAGFDASADHIDAGGGFFYAGDFCSRRNPGFEAAALSGMDAGKAIRARLIASK